MRRILTAKLAAVLALCLAAVWPGTRPALATVVLDQEYWGQFPNFSGGISTGTLRRLQTFTVGQAGHLVRVEVLGSTNMGSSHSLSILGTSLRVPTGSPLANGAFASAIPGPASQQVVTFSLTGLAVAVGDVLAFEVVGPGGLVSGMGPGSYAGGSDFIVNPPFITTLSATESDAFFRTYVDDGSEPPVGVPAPAALGLFGLGLLGLAAVRRRA
jgi:hypothetical protein